MPTSKPAPFPRRPRSHFSRSRAGCLTCRSRRKKCDEQKPICGGCDRGKRSCQWPNDAAKGGADGAHEAEEEDPALQRRPSGSLPSAAAPKTPPPVPGIVPVRVSQRSPGNTSAVPPVPVLIHSGAMPLAQPPAHNVLGFLPHPGSFNGPRRPQTPPPVPGIIPVQVSRRTPEEHGFDPRRYPPAVSSSQPDPRVTHSPPISVQLASYHMPSVQSSSPPHAAYPHAGVPLPTAFPITGPMPISTSSPPIASVPVTVPMPEYAPHMQPMAGPHIGMPAHSQPLSLSGILSPEGNQLPPSNIGTTVGVMPNVIATGSSPEYTTFTTSPTTTSSFVSGAISSSPLSTANNPALTNPVTPEGNFTYEADLPKAYSPAGSSFMDAAMESDRDLVFKLLGAASRPNPLSISGLVDNSLPVPTVEPQYPQQGFVYSVDEYPVATHAPIPPSNSSQNSRPPHARPPTPIKMAGYARFIPSEDTANPVSSVSSSTTALIERQLLNFEPAVNPMTEGEFSKMLVRFVVSKQAELELNYDVDCDMDLADIQHAEDNHIVTTDEATRLRQRRARFKSKRAQEDQAELRNIQLYQTGTSSSAGRGKAFYQAGQRMYARIMRSRPTTVPHATQNFRLDPRSHLLFKHYLDTVADQLVTCADNVNPFRRLVIPLAAQDDIIMHAMLASGGAYFCFPESPDKALGTVSRYHYSVVLNRLPAALQGGKYMGESERVSLVSVMLLLSLFETLSGNIYGSILMHMTACRSVLLSLISDPPKDPASDIGTMFGFLCECYCYTGTLAALSSVLRDRKTAIEIDPFMRDLSHLRRFPTYRCFLGVGHSLFQMITDIIDLGIDRFAEEERGEASIEVFVRYQDLLKRIDSWVDPDDDGDMRMDWRNASGVYQHTMIILLHSIYYHDLFSEPEVISDVRQRVEMAFPLLLSVALSSNVGAMMMFPCLVFASCTEHDWLRDTLRYGIMAAKFRSCSTKQGLLIMETMWADPTPESFGPRGLGYIMRKHNIIFPMT